MRLNEGLEERLSVIVPHRAELEREDDRAPSNVVPWRPGQRENVGRVGGGQLNPVPKTLYETRDEGASAVWHI